MFDIGWGELLVIAMVALIAIGPKELPGALRTLGQWMGKVRRMAGEFQNQFHDAIREAELHDLKKEVDEMAAQATSYTHFDPLADVRKDIESAVGELPPVHEPPADTSAASVTSTSSEAPAASADAALPPPASENAPPAELPPPLSQSAVEAAPMAPLGEGETVEAVPGAAMPDAGKPPA
jgi:sec-independent protein translocase protein TatB